MFVRYAPKGNAIIKPEKEGFVLGTGQRDINVRLKGVKMMPGNVRVCRRHGAKKIHKKQCSAEGCKSNAQKGGLCYKHGAGYTRPRTLCTYERCGNLAQSGGVCRRHGYVRKRCMHDDCKSEARSKGVCAKHGKK